MPPKKAVQEEKTMLGRPSNNLKIGVVGLPNVGKSTFFNALTNASAAAENYPFCTIDPEESRVAVPDERFDWLCQHYKPKKEIPAFLTVIDIAGLVKGASSGAGLGNAFLSHIKAVDAIFHVVRAFDEADVIHVEGELDPIRDLQIIREELRLKDEEFLTKQSAELNAAVRRVGNGGNAQDKLKKEEAATIEKVLKYIQEGNDVRHGTWSNKEVEVINGYHLITAKPVIYLANLSEKDYIRKKNKWLPKIKGWIDENSPGDQMIPFSGSFEYRLSLAETPEDKQAILDEAKATLPATATNVEVKSALPNIIIKGYAALNLIYYFTGGPDEVRAWTVRKNTKAPGAAGVIHSDFERGFIMAEVMKYDDLKELGSDNAVKAGGKL
ncbi:hypothetical protein [Parasitella parasitica]|uniref:OBG-type G domain-containing protein n=1 Tax=Parasitella parasitica TaxID=35722 RepID=A0A0B7NUR9_9FUNG|nr:hypothetical protein [Parasitella parasitica]